MTGHGRPSIDHRGPGTDLFDDPPWDGRLDVERKRRDGLRHVAIVVFLVSLGILGVMTATTLVGLVHDFPLGPIGSFDLTPSPSSANGIDIALSPNGTVAYVTEPTNNRLVVFNAWTGQVRATVGVGNDPAGLALSPDGTQVWVVNTTPTLAGAGPSGPGAPSGLGSGSVTVVSTATDEVLGTIAVGVDPIDVAFSPDGRSAYVTNNGALSPGLVSVIDTSTRTVVRTLTPTTTPSSGSPGQNPTSVAVTPDGKEVWVSVVNDMTESSSWPNDVGAGASSTSTFDGVSVFDAATGAQVAQIPVGTGPFFMVLSHDGREAYVADKLSCDVREIDTATFQVVATVAWPSSSGCPYGLAAGPDDNVVDTVTGSDHTFNEAHAGHAFGSVDFATGRADVAGQIGRNPVTVALSPDAATAYVVDADNPEIDLVDPRDGSVKAVFRIPD
jgi:YVTN family beta-propeller protein